MLSHRNQTQVTKLGGEYLYLLKSSHPPTVNHFYLQEPHPKYLFVNFLGFFFPLGFFIFQFDVLLTQSLM